MAGLVALAQGLYTRANEKRTVAQIYKDVSYLGLGATKNINATYSLIFQYFPETLSDDYGVNYQSKEIPGGSMPLMQYVNGQARTISFSAHFSTDLDPGVDENVDGFKEFSDRNRDIRKDIGFLRSCMLPYYYSNQVYPPPRVVLTLKNSGIGIVNGGSSAGSDSIYCVMTQCTIKWESWFPSGAARTASVELGFQQIVQVKNTVIFPTMTQEMADFYSDRKERI